MAPPSSTARKEALENWRTPPQGRDLGNRPPVGALPQSGSCFKKHADTVGPMAVQQQQQGREPQLQRLLPQRNSGKPAKPKPTAKEADALRKGLEENGQVLPDGQKKKPLPGETTGAA